MNFPNLHFILFFFFFFFESILLEETLVRDLPTIFSLNLFSIFFGFGLRNQPGVARRRSRSQFGLGSAPPPAPLRSLGKTRHSVCPRMANCSDVFFSPFPASHSRRHSWRHKFPNLFLLAQLELFVCLFFARVDFSDSPSRSVHFRLSNCERERYRMWIERFENYFNQRQEIATSAQVAMDAVKSPEANR